MDVVVVIFDEFVDLIVLVGYSGGGVIVWGVVDVWLDCVVCVIYVDSFLFVEGGCVNDELLVVDGEVLLFDWLLFEVEDLIDFDDGLCECFCVMVIFELVWVMSDLIYFVDLWCY